MLRRCYSCKLEKPIIEFAKNKREKFGRGYQCLFCLRGEWRATSKVKEKDYERIATAQRRKCAICNTQFPDLPTRELKKVLLSDHNHVTQQIRGLLCHKCNTGIGMLQDSPELLEKAALYLRSYATAENNGE